MAEQWREMNVHGVAAQAPCSHAGITRGTGPVELARHFPPGGPPPATRPATPRQATAVPHSFPTIVTPRRALLTAWCKQRDYRNSLFVPSKIQKQSVIIKVVQLLWYVKSEKVYVIIVLTNMRNDIYYFCNWTLFNKKKFEIEMIPSDVSPVSGQILVLWCLTR